MSKVCEKCGVIIIADDKNLCSNCAEELGVPAEYQGYVKPNYTPYVVSNESKQYWLVTALKVLSWLELIAGIVLAFACGWEDKLYIDNEFNAVIFFCCLVGGVIGFVIFQALSVCVMAANKYLNN